MKPSKTLSIFAVFIFALIWAYALFMVPTFDLDESLYRRVAEELKWNHQLLTPVWDGKPLYHKPPVFYWLIALLSFIIDGANAGVSILSARLPSLLASLGILFAIARHQKVSFLRTFLIWGCILFPFLTSTSVLFDPLQTLALLPCLLIPHRAFSERRIFTKKEYLLMSLSMFAGSAIKGLTGLILPTLAIGMHLLLCNRKNLKHFFHSSFLFFIYSFLPACILTFIYYLWLDHAIGRGFTEEFFLVHHLGRGTSALESHHGPFYYYWIVLLLGGGFFIPLFFNLFFNKRFFQYTQLGFPLTFSFAILFFFSLSATKLPHYLWPVWPALLLQLLSLKDSTPAPPLASRAALIPLGIWGIALFWLVLNPEILPFVQMTPLEIFSLATSATLFICGIFFYKKLSQQIEVFALFAAITTLFLIVPSTQVAARLMVHPFYEVVKKLKTLHPKESDCIRYTGPMSATLSLAMGQELGKSFTHNRCEPNQTKFLIVPIQKKNECSEKKMSVALEGPTLMLCFVQSGS